MIKSFVVTIFYDFSYKLLKERSRDGIIILWQWLRPVSIKLVLWKRLGLFVSITSIDVPFCDLIQVMSFTRLESEQVSHKSDKWLCISPLFRVSKLVFKSHMSIFSYFLAKWLIFIFLSIITYLIPSKMLTCCCYKAVCKKTLNTIFFHDYIVACKKTLNTIFFYKLLIRRIFET